MPATAAWICDALARRRPERQRRAEEQERRQEDCDERDRGARDAVRRRVLDRAEVGREREQRPRHRLGGAVAGEERLLGDPARSDDGLVEERQHDVAAAEDERAGAVEAVEQVEGVRRSRRRAASGRPTSKHDEGDCATRSRCGGRSGTRIVSGSARTRPRNATTPIAPATRIVATWPNEPGHEQRDRGRRRRRSAALSRAACERPRHRDHRRRDDRGRRELEAVHPARVRRGRRRAPRSRAPSGSTAEGSVNPSHAARPPSLPARCTPTAIPTWLDEGPGRRFESATSSPNCSSPIQLRRATYSSRK